MVCKTGCMAAVVLMFSVGGWCVSGRKGGDGDVGRMDDDPLFFSHYIRA